MDLWLITGRPSAVLQSLWRAVELRSRVEMLVGSGLDSLIWDNDNGGGELLGECDEDFATNVPSRVACRRSRNFSAASSSRLAASSFL